MAIFGILPQAIVADVAEKDIYNGNRALNRALLLGFRRAGVECPFPQLDGHNR